MTSLTLWLLCMQLIATTTIVYGYERTTVFPLKRLTPHELNLTKLNAIDSARHGRLLQSSPVRGVFSFPVEVGALPIFRCSSLMEGRLSQPETPVHGIVGLGRGRESLLSQLSTRGLVRRVFSLCLSGDEDSEGLMVLGENKMPTIVYTPLVQSRTHYNVNLKTVAVNDAILPIHPSVFSVGYGTIIDFGTILVYFLVEAYDPIVILYQTKQKY